MLRQVPFDLPNTPFLAVGHNDDRAIHGQISEDPQQGLDAFTFVATDEGHVGEEGIQTNEFAGPQNMRKSHGVDVHVLVPLRKRVGQIYNPLAQEFEASVLFHDRDQTSARRTRRLDRLTKA